MTKNMTKNIQHIGITLVAIAFGLFFAANWLGSYQLTTEAVQQSIAKPVPQAQVLQQFNLKNNATAQNKFAAIAEINTLLHEAQNQLNSTQAADAWDNKLSDYEVKSGTFEILRHSTTAATTALLQTLFWWIFGLGLLGAFLFILPELGKPEGIRNTNNFKSSMTYRGVLGIGMGAFLIGFYIALYFFPYYITNWVVMLDPISRALNGNAASQWFLYGFLYTVCVAVMGVRMLVKYRHNAYQMVRTASVIFFQLVFAFLIPQIMERLHQPAVDLKNMWPLDYSFFFDYKLNEKLQHGTLGIFLLVWGIVLFVVGVPLFTYLFGKRWYCSWVCGCGGLAETLGDPYRHLSDKSTKAWRVERYLIHGVLALCIVMTTAVLVTYFTGGLGISYAIRDWYGFLIGSIFSGVVGTGFYPLMGNRTWCRFGCPLAAYMGLVQRFQSRFRITTNGAQCISCGNCSTYCEQGIDVRAYAQKGQDIVRASCVGCGVCAAVCPRGVLRLENGSDTKGRASQERTVHIRLEEVFVTR
jgi:ferredoxin-type protein NapH